MDFKLRVLNISHYLMLVNYPCLDSAYKGNKYSDEANRQPSDHFDRKVRSFFDAVYCFPLRLVRKYHKSILYLLNNICLIKTKGRGVLLTHRTSKNVITCNILSKARLRTLSIQNVFIATSPLKDNRMGIRKCANFGRFFRVLWCFRQNLVH